jgi:hypothetical protein
VHAITPDMWISISSKWHGTSAVFANLLVKRELGWLERLLKRLGVKIQESEYGYIWSSRRVVKGVGGQEKENSIHYYDSDIWGLVAKEVEDRIPKGFTVYGEIVGWTPEGSPIQPGYAYGCQKGSHRLVVYRVTITNPDGKVIELSWQHKKQFCEKHGFEMVKELWFGRAAEFGREIIPSLDTITLHEWQVAFARLVLDSADSNDWQIAFSKLLENQYVGDRMCQYNNNEVPAEGVVLKVDRLDEAIALKQKSFLFLKRESEALDKGELDIETEQSEVPDAGDEEAA